MAQPDYQPLTRGEVEDLLLEALTVKRSAMDGNTKTKRIARVQVRLDRAIPGIETPRAIDGTVAERENTLDYTYVQWIQSVDESTEITDDLVETFMQIIGGEEA